MIVINIPQAVITQLGVKYSNKAGRDVKRTINTLFLVCNVLSYVICAKLYSEIP